MVHTVLVCVVTPFVLLIGSSPVKLFFQAEDGLRDVAVTGLQTCALPICIHVSSFRMLKNANSEIARLQKQGLIAFSQNVHVKGKGMWHRVYVGKFRNIRLAKDMAYSLKRKGIIDYSHVLQLIR